MLAVEFESKHVHIQEISNQDFLHIAVGEPTLSLVLSNLPTDPFTILESRDQEMSEYSVVQERILMLLSYEDIVSRAFCLCSFELYLLVEMICFACWSSTNQNEAATPM